MALLHSATSKRQEEYALKWLMSVADHVRTNGKSRQPCIRSFEEAQPPLCSHPRWQRAVSLSAGPSV